MSAPEFAAGQPVPSPCVSLCRMDRDSGMCRGCFRMIEEIVQWRNADDDFKRAVWMELGKRREAAALAPQVDDIFGEGW
jgi:predicted Fe-S protein YdhL (DUF1289 family)